MPYPHKSKEVTAEGFVRDQPTLAQKAVKRCERWHEERRKLTSVPSRGANDGDTTHMELSPTKFIDAIDWDREQTFDSSHNFRTPGIRKQSFAAGPSAYRSLAMIQEGDNNSKQLENNKGMLRNTLSRDYRNIKRQTNLTAALFSGATNLNITSHKSSSPSPRIAEPYAGFRLCETALGYDFAHRPFEDKMKKARKDKDQFQKEMYGLRGSPKRSQDRHVNKLFDHSRRNTRNLGMCDGCDVNYSIREQVMTVGKVPRGDYRGLDPDVAYGREYKAMNIDRDSVQERHIARTIEQDRGRTTSSYEGENHFHNKFRKQPRKLSRFSSFMEESQFGQGGRSICSSNY